MNKLIDWGVAGFSIDAAKYIWPADLFAIFKRLHHLNTSWFPAETEPYIYQEVCLNRCNLKSYCEIYACDQHCWHIFGDGDMGRAHAERESINRASEGRALSEKLDQNISPMNQGNAVPP
jgi:glycosidase